MQSKTLAVYDELLGTRLAQRYAESAGVPGRLDGRRQMK
jgi:hypothetical protein